MCFGNLCSSKRSARSSVDGAARFNKGTRDLGKTAMERPEAMERIVNKASDKALRCVEIAGGAKLTEAEIKATKKSEINSECPTLANPNYKPYNE